MSARRVHGPDDRQAALDLARRSFSGAFVYFIVLLVVSISTPYTRDHPNIVKTVGVATLAIAAVRVWAARHLLKAPKSVKVARTLRIAILATFTVWGAFCVVTLHFYGGGWTGMLVLLITSGLAGGATTSLAPDRELAWTCLIILMLPSAIWMLRPNVEDLALATVTLLYLAYLLVQIGQNWRSYVKARRATESDLAKIRAENLARTKADFLAHMSHEIRTPMQAVVAALDLVAGSPPNSPSQREALEVGQASARHLLSLLNGILDLSKAEAGRLELERIPFRLNETLAAALKGVAFNAREKGLQFSYQSDFGPDDYYTGDPTRLGQILVNLAANAVKFTPQGSVTIHVSREIASPGKDRVTITVSDTGIGVSPEIAKTLFAPYQQAGPSISRTYGGTGLGLSIARQLATLMNGSIEVSSQVGKGSTFTVSVDLEKGERPAEPVARAQPRTPPADTAPRVLVAEDDRISQVVLVRLLKRLGYEADVVGDGRQAVDACLAKRYHAVLMDCHMPDMDGIAACREIRAKQRASQRTPIFAITASALDDERKNCHDAGMDAFLGKPVTLETLARLLAETPQPANSPRPAAAGR